VQFGAAGQRRGARVTALRMSVLGSGSVGLAIAASYVHAG